MTLFESLSYVGHLMTSLYGKLFTIWRRFLKTLFAWSKSKVLRPLRQPELVAESPSTNTSFLPSGEKVGTIITVAPRPQLPALWLLTSTGAVPTVFGVCQTTYG